MAKKNKDYLDFGYGVSLVLAIFIPTCWILGIVTRLNEKKTLAAVIRIFLGFNILWIIDIISMIANKKIFRAL